MKSTNDCRKYLTHDIHTHTHLSLCCSAPGIADTYIEDAEKRGLSVFGFSDHFWDENVPLPGDSEFYRVQNLEHVMQIKNEITRKSDKVKILIGAESDFCFGKILGVTEKIAEQLDFLLIPHSHTHMLDFVMPKEYDNDIPKHSEYLVRSFLALCEHPMKKYITAVAHPFIPVAKNNDYRVRILDAISEAQYIECFEALAASGMGFEINTAFLGKMSEDEIRNHPYMNVLKLVKKCGCKFSLGSDAHSLEGLEHIEKASVVMSEVDITDADFIELVK